ncbi:hypothetical protein B0H19DRAFT_1243858 [Mycena capillaripes]|nr:hypothetical protein B0H19DRAFT_1243858 [Mycena capillaripes]
MKRVARLEAARCVIVEAREASIHGISTPRMFAPQPRIHVHDPNIPAPDPQTRLSAETSAPSSVARAIGVPASSAKLVVCEPQAMAAAGTRRGMAAAWTRQQPGRERGSRSWNIERRAHMGRRRSPEDRHSASCKRWERALDVATAECVSVVRTMSREVGARQRGLRAVEGACDLLRRSWETQPASAMTAASWHLTGVGPTLAMALARRWLGVDEFLCSFVTVGIFFVFSGLAPRLKLDAEPINCGTQLRLPTLTKEQRNSPTPNQRLANAMASVGPTPVKCHEAAVMALAGCEITDALPESSHIRHRTEHNPPIPRRIPDLRLLPSRIGRTFRDIYGCEAVRGGVSARVHIDVVREEVIARRSPKPVI